MKVATSVQMLCLAAVVCLATRAARGEEPAGLQYPVKVVTHTATRGGPPMQVRLLTQTEDEYEPEPDDQYEPQPDSVSETETASEPEALGAPSLIEGESPWQEAGPAGCDLCGGCGSGCGGDCGGCSMGSRGCLGNLWYGGVDYLLFRPRMSQAVAAVRRQQTSNTTVTPQTSTVTDTVIEYPFDYNSGFRVFAGYRLLDCGGNFEVAYWRMVNNSQQVTEGPTTGTTFIAGNLENNPATGQFLNAATGITANIIDATFTKCISMGGPRGPCDECFCPRWGLQFFAGARVGDIIRYNDNTVNDADGNATSYGNIGARFTGAGPRIGFLSRRYLGPNGYWSVYAKGAQSILIGSYRMSRELTVPGSADTPTQITNEYNTYSRTIPVTDVEVGLSWQPTPFTFVSVGYFFQCWWDLGQSEQISGTNFGPLDTSNILGFDGLFVRGEMLF